jgi:hypothetical protein
MWDFGPSFIEWWAGLTPLVRYLVAFFLIILGAALCYFSGGGYLVWGSWLAAGVILLMFAGRSRNE